MSAHMAHGRFCSTLTGLAVSTAHQLLDSALAERHGHTVIVTDAIEQAVAGTFVTSTCGVGYTLASQSETQKLRQRHNEYLAAAALPERAAVCKAAASTGHAVPRQGTLAHDMPGMRGDVAEKLLERAASPTAVSTLSGCDAFCDAASPRSGPAPPLERQTRRSASLSRDALSRQYTSFSDRAGGDLCDELLSPIQERERTARKSSSMRLRHSVSQWQTFADSEQSTKVLDAQRGASAGAAHHRVSTAAADTRVTFCLTEEGISVESVPTSGHVQSAASSDQGERTGAATDNSSSSMYTEHPAVAVAAVHTQAQTAVRPTGAHPCPSLAQGGALRSARMQLDRQPMVAITKRASRPSTVQQTVRYGSRHHRQASVAAATPMAARQKLRAELARDLSDVCLGATASSDATTLHMMPSRPNSAGAMVNSDARSAEATHVRATGSPTSRPIVASLETIESAKDKASMCAANCFGMHLPRGRVHADFTGLQMQEMPWLAGATWLQSLALSFNSLRAVPPLHSTALRSLNMACNGIRALPDGLAAAMPNLQVRLT